MSLLRPLAAARLIAISSRAGRSRARPGDSRGGRAPTERPAEVTDSAGEFGTVIVMTNHSVPGMPPLIMAAPLARQLAATVPGIVPTAMLQAAAAVLRVSSCDVLEDVRAHPRRH